MTSLFPLQFCGPCVKITESMSARKCGSTFATRRHFQFYIGCEKCSEWYHGRCVGILQCEAEKNWRLHLPKVRPKFSVQPTQRWLVALGHDGGTGPGQAESQAGQAEHPRNVQVSLQSIISKIFPAPNLHLKTFFGYYVKKILRSLNQSSSGHAVFIIKRDNTSYVSSKGYNPL